MDISFVIPTHNRPEILVDTVDRLGKLDSDCFGGGAELIVVDNHSDQRAMFPPILDNGITARVIRLGENRGAAARNVGVEHSQGQWVVMLDDDSSLLPCPASATLKSMPAEVYAVGGEIHLPCGRHESGGLPEVVIGCGCAYRRDRFLELGGYDPAFDFYAEEYDLCAKIILAGGRVVHDAGLQFEHRKATQGRSFNRIIHRLVRNNGWVIARYAPQGALQDAMDAMIDRYSQIARKEGAVAGYEAGLDALFASAGDQRRSAMSQAQWDRFIGVAAAKDHLAKVLDPDVEEVHLVHPGKGEREIVSVLAMLGREVLKHPKEGGWDVIGTLSPGPLTDAKMAKKDAVEPWAGFGRG